MQGEIEPGAPIEQSDEALSNDFVVIDDEETQGPRGRLLGPDQARYVRGQVGTDFEGNLIGLGDPRAQTEQAMRNVKQLLEEADNNQFAS